MTKNRYTPYEFKQLPLCDGIPSEDLVLGKLYRSNYSTAKVDSGESVVHILRKMKHATYGMCTGYVEVHIIRAPDSRVMI